MKFGNWKVRSNNFKIPKLRWLPMVRSLVVFFAIIAGVSYGLSSQSIPATWMPESTPVMAQVNEPVDKINLLSIFKKLVKADDLNYEGILKSELPLWNKVNNANSRKDTREAINKAVYSVTQMDLTNPGTYLQAEIPMMALVDKFTAISADKLPKSVSQEAAKVEPKPEKKLSDDVLVAIYNTHTTESYLPSQGVERTKGTPGGVYQVSQELKKALEEKYGIRTISSDKVHDAVNFNFSYGSSLETARELVDQNKNLKVLIDLHRDGGYNDKSVTTTKINGQDVAKIYLIMGTDGNLPYPNWQKNKAFAEKLNTKMNAMYPGLSRGVKQDIYRYNQHLHDHAILIEVGGVDNTLDDVKRAADLFADVLASVVNEQQN